MFSPYLVGFVNVGLPDVDAAGGVQVTAEGGRARARGCPPGFAVNTVCRLELTPPPPAPLSLPALGCPPTSQTGTDDRAMKSLPFNSCSNTFCFRLTVAEPFSQHATGRDTHSQTLTNNLSHSHSYLWTVTAAHVVIFHFVG